MQELDLAGLIPAVVTPMREGGEIDEDGMRQYIRWLLAFDGLKALAVNMDTGEGPALTPEERHRVLEVYSEEISDRLPMLAGVGASSTAAAVEMARDAQQAGASGLVVFPHPTFVGEPLPPAVPYEYHRAIAEATELPMVLFQLQPTLGGVNFSKETLLKLISIPNVVAIKEGSFDAVRFVETVRILTEGPKRIQILTGNDNFILESFVLGAQGALIGFGTIAIAEQLEMLARLRDGDMNGARRIYTDVVQPLVSIIFAPPVRNYRARVKEALVALGVIEGAYVRPPLLPLEPAERAAVREVVERARLKAPAGARG